MGLGIGGIGDKIKNAVRQVAEKVQHVAQEVGKKVNEITHPAVRAHQGESGFDDPKKEYAQTRDRPGGPTVYKPGDGPTVC